MFVTFEGIDGSGQDHAGGAARRARSARRATTSSPRASRAARRSASGPRAAARRAGDERRGPRPRCSPRRGPSSSSEVIRPALDRGADVVCDRYVDSSLAYQGIARGLGLERGPRAQPAVDGGLLPDAHLPPARRPRGRAARGAAPIPTGSSARTSTSSRRVDRGYRELAERLPERDRRRRRRPVAAGRRCAGARHPWSSFERLPEQPEAKRLLARRSREGPAHAYLFHGPRGVGKRAAALAFAGELLGDAARVERRTHPDLTCSSRSAT